MMRVMSDKVYIGESKIQDKGIFAKKDIKKGEKILEFIGLVANFAQDNPGDHSIQIDVDRFMDLDEPGRSINHSCNPNAGIMNDITLVAIKDIKIGEEIFIDYSTTMDEDYWTMECNCREPNCRGKIKDFKHLPEKLRKKYLDLGIVQKFIKRQYK